MGIVTLTPYHVKMMCKRCNEIPQRLKGRLQRSNAPMGEWRVDEYKQRFLHFVPRTHPNHRSSDQAFINHLITHF